MAEKKGLDFDKELEIIKTISELNESRIKLYGDPAILDRAVKCNEALKQEIKQLRKEKFKPAQFDVISEFQPSKEKGGQGHGQPARSYNRKEG